MRMAAGRRMASDRGCKEDRTEAPEGEQGPQQCSTSRIFKINSLTIFVY